jgi:hypothetical protein
METFLYERHLTKKNNVAVAKPLILAKNYDPKKNIKKSNSPQPDFEPCDNETHQDFDSMLVFSASSIYPAFLGNLEFF